MRNSYIVPLKHKPSYNGRYFWQMVQDYGARGAAEKILASEEIPSGLIALYHLGMLDLSVEAIVLKPQYKEPHQLFTAQQREKARQRLKFHFNYTAPWDTGD
jgi:hypothetical protein